MVTAWQGLQTRRIRAGTGRLHRLLFAYLQQPSVRSALLQHIHALRTAVFDMAAMSVGVALEKPKKQKCDK